MVRVLVVVGLLLLLLLLVVVGATFILSDLCMIQKNKSIDTSETRYCAKNQPFVTSIFAKGWQKQFCIFCIFFPLDLQNDLKIQICSDLPNIIRGCPIFFINLLCNYSLCLKNPF